MSANSCVTPSCLLDRRVMTPVIYDASHLVSRMAARAITGIDCVDLAFGRHFAAAETGISAAFCRGARPHILSASALREIIGQSQRRFAEAGRDDGFVRIRNWLAGQSPGQAAPMLSRAKVAQLFAGKCWEARCRVTPSMAQVPRNAVYLNIAEHWLEHHRYFDWLGERPDVRAVFFVHDVLPLDYPEYFRPGYQAIFQRRFETIARRGTAFIVSTHAVRERLIAALPAAKRQAPIHVAPLPSPLALQVNSAPDAIAHPYFLLVGTIEPRKNHLLILNIWRDLAAKLGDATPRLVLIGSRGWENEQVVDLLDRCEGIRKHVLRAEGVGSQGLAWLMVRAQALLMPSFDEGYGLPVVEALSQGTPVIASDIATFREITGGRAILLSPLDGMSWAEKIMALSDRKSEAWQTAKAQAQSFHAPDWGSYFQGVGAFLSMLP